jgi:hypothetical protein
LPAGVSYVGELADYNSERFVWVAAERQKWLNAHPETPIELKPFQQGSAGPLTDTFKICEFVIDIERVSVKGLISMRPILPFQEYRLLKNRKCARECRKKKKHHTFGVQEELELLRKLKTSL